MKLYEYQGKQIFREHGIAIPRGFVISSAEDLRQKQADIPNKVVVKAQVLQGGRGKAGLIKCTEKSCALGAVEEILKKADKILVEEQIEIEKELYLSLTINRSEKNINVIFCEDGGIEIEELADKSPEKITRIGLNEYDEALIKAGLPEEYCNSILPIIKKLFQIMKSYDAELVEINPLVLSKGKLIAADAKIIIDDNSLFRHQEFIGEKKDQLTDIEKKASDYGLQYVELEGDIAVIGNGAGLVMATLDILGHFGGKPANFLDVGGGASVEVMEKSIEIITMKNPGAIFINIFGGITRCDDIANGIVNYTREHNIEIPLVVRMIGTNEQEGKEILNKNGISSLDSMEECARKVVELVK